MVNAAVMETMHAHMLQNFKNSDPVAAVFKSG